MGKIVSNFFISLDGVVESPDQWHFDYFNDEMGATIGQASESYTGFLMGRVLYEEWSSYWPNQGDDVPFAPFINNVEKYVVSSSLDELNLMLHPIAVGHGRRLFEDTPTYPLQLVSAETFKTGVLNLSYAPAGS